MTSEQRTVQSNLSTTTTLGTPKLWPLCTGGCWSEVPLSFNERLFMTSQFGWTTSVRISASNRWTQWSATLREIGKFPSIWPPSILHGSTPEDWRLIAVCEIFNGVVENIVVASFTSNFVVVVDVHYSANVNIIQLLSLWLRMVLLRKMF